MPVQQTPQGTTKGSAPKKSTAAARKRLKKLHVQPTDNGGFLVTHHHQPEYGGTPKAETHAFTSYDDMAQHVEKTMRVHA